MRFAAHKPTRHAFSLVEVVLAIGVLSLAIVALLGLFGPTIGSVKQVIDTNLATAAVSRINTEIARGMTWDEALEATNNDYIFYVWKRQAETGDPVEFVMSEGSTNGSDDSADLPDGGTADLSDDLANGRLIDTPMLVTFERGMQGGTNPYDFTNVANEGYFPILINIFPIDPNQAGETGYDSVVAIKENMDPIFTYTHAKTRSL